ncbi:YfhO family protein [Actinobacillus equuli subsp. equuli]|uniref:YfhO family protein n=1 Tax=Actinobacillus equuli TaxID=718 RepID=UPI002441E946|nr:YfhO family protein [Actinobacillus equuli]WGE54977.1 YfhO family protein [Actinobacillus equuli subsp. equuli]
MANKILRKYLFIFCISWGIGGVFLYLNKITPFGIYSLASMDADIQYLDLFAYLKDVLSGNKTIGYNFSKGLGGNTFAIFSYYLASPVNIFLIFFDKSELNMFFSFAFLIKIALSSVFCLFFLVNRFRNLPLFYSILLSLGYAMSQYSILQASNIMWLDGVYMLPLILLGIYRVVNNKGLSLLAISVAFSMIFNWYSGIINCLFSILWLFFELIYKGDRIKGSLLSIFKYSIGMLCGLLLCSVVFVPTYFELQNGKGGLDLWLFNFGFTGNLFSLLNGLVLGAKENKGVLVLFSGSLALIGLTLYLSHLRNNWNRKSISVFILLMVTIMVFYWNPLILIFSIFKKVDSYWYRYSYFAHFVLIFIAGFSFSFFKIEFYKILKYGVLFFSILLGVSYIKNTSPELIYFSMSYYFIQVAFLWFVLNGKSSWRLSSMIFLFIMSSSELIQNFGLIKNVNTNGRDFVTYEKEQELLVKDIQSQNDKDFYRVSSLKNRKYNSENITAYYLDSFYHNYSGLNTYTSSPDNTQLEFLNTVGYPKYAGTLNVVNTSILPLDSLLGVRYFLSDVKIIGFDEVDTIQSRNGKSVYYNSYVLPVGLSYFSKDVKNNVIFNNPFENINSIYSTILGERASIFERIEYSFKQHNNMIDISFNGNGDPVYGYIDTKRELNGRLILNNRFLTGYSKWLAPRVVYLGNDVVNSLRLETKADLKGNISDIAIYRLNMKFFATVIDQIKQNNKAQAVEISDGLIRIKTRKSSEESKLFIAIPYNSAWRVLMNGNEIKPEPFFNGLMAIPLEINKDNVIEMTYSIPKLSLGVILSLLGILIFIVLLFSKNKFQICKDITC